MTWRTLTIGEFVDTGAADIQTGPFGTQLSARDYVDEGTPVINVRNIGYGGLKADKLEFVTEKTTERLAAHLLEPRDIVFGRKGAVDRHLYVSEGQEHWMQGSDCIRLRFHTDEIIPRFVSYLFLHEAHQQWMLVQSGNKATMASLNHDIIKRISLHVPAPAVQKEIVTTLSAYDNLIDNNQRRMALLEEAARQLYREWFVRLRFPGHEHARITNGVPKGWDRKPVFDAVEILSGGTPKTTAPEYWDGNIPFYTPKDASDGFWVTDCERRITELGLQRCNSRLYPKETVFISARGTVGKLNLAQSPMAMSQSCYALVGKEGLSQLFVFMAMQAAVDAFRQHAVGAVFDAIVVDTFKRIYLVVPEPKIVRIFEEFIRPVLAQLENLTLQNQKLRAARDLLLPRLMSGEIAV
jgi:type I restriction enzyme S subunit